MPRHVVAAALALFVAATLPGCGPRTEQAGHQQEALDRAPPPPPGGAIASPAVPEEVPDVFASEPATTPVFGASVAFPPLPRDPELEPLPQGPLEIQDVRAWFKGTTVLLRFFPRPSVGTGRSHNQHADIFVFVRSDGTPIEQPFLLEAVPKGAAGPDVIVPDEVARAFSTRWEVHVVRMADSYDPNDPAQVVDSTTKLLRSSVLEDIETNAFLNCPVLPPGATIPADPSVIHSAVWNGHPVRIATYEVDDAPQRAIPLYVFQGPDGGFVGRPVVVRVPGQANYSSLWDVRAVQVPAGFLPNSLRSHEAIVASRLPVRSLGFQVNCPVTAVTGPDGTLVPVRHEDLSAVLYGPDGKFSDLRFPLELRGRPFSPDRVFRIIDRGLSTDDANHNFLGTLLDPAFPLMTGRRTRDVQLEGLIHDDAGKLIHLEQADLDRGRLTPPLDAKLLGYLPAEAPFSQKVALVGRALFEHEFTKEEGSGPVLNRMSCAACHGMIATGGGGGSSFNVQQAPGPDTFDGVPAASQLARALGGPLPALDVPPAIMRRTPHVFGAGLKDALALERLPDGSDANAFPFKRKGTVPSLRAFTIGALEGELGMQSVEKVAQDRGVPLDAAKTLDPDGDGVTAELTVGDVTALVVFQASLPAPGRQPVLGLTRPGDPLGSDGLLRSERTFRTPIEQGGLGCASCHVPWIPLRASTLGIGNPETAGVVTLPLPATGLAAYSDFKRHKLGPLDADLVPQEGVAPDVFLTKELWGLGSSLPLLHDGSAGADVGQAILRHRGVPLEGAGLEVRTASAPSVALVQTSTALRVVLPEGELAATLVVTAPRDRAVVLPLRVVVTRLDPPGATVVGATSGGTGPGATFVGSGLDPVVSLVFASPGGAPVSCELVVVDEAGSSEALPSVEAWLRQSDADRAAVVRFLRSLRVGEDSSNDQGFEVENP